MMYKTAILFLLSVFFPSIISAQKHFCVNPHTGATAEARTDSALEIFVPETPNGTIILMCPGGGYAHKAYEHEGTDWVDWFDKQSITTAVLSYTLPKDSDTQPLRDVEASFKWLKENATTLGFNDIVVGIMGFSAGGHLASTAATHADSLTRPDFQILLYPVISMREDITHGGTCLNLLGPDPDPERRNYYSNEKHVDSDTPRAFIVTVGDDHAVDIRNSLLYYNALSKAGVPSELHIYPSGGHGFGMRESFPDHERMLAELAAWLKKSGFVR